MKIKKIIIGYILILLFSSCMTFNSYGYEEQSTILHVGGIGEGNFSSIQSAIDTASDDSIVYIYNGVYTENIIINKSISLIGENQESTIIQGDKSDNVITLIGENINISNLNIMYSGIPVISNNSGNLDNITIDDINESGYNDKNETVNSSDIHSSLQNINVNYSGIYIESESVSIYSCKLSDNHIGIIFQNSSDGIIKKCKLYDNIGGINIFKSNNIEIFSCEVTNNEEGITIQQTFFAKIVNNLIESNNGVGISISGSSDSVISNNNLNDNIIGVVVASECKNNLLYNNNFINNNNNAIEYCINSWDNGIFGNYWDDYSGVDLNSDGIGDEPYPIPKLFISNDSYPLMEPSIYDIMSPIIISLTYPYENENTSGEITISGTVECKETIKSVQVKIDKGELLEVNGKDNWQLEYDTNLIENGIHHLYVYVICNNGDYSVESFSFIVDNEINENNGGSSMPGFELLFALLSIFIVYLLIRRN